MTDETKNESPQEVLPPGQKYALTILEASSYFSIGVKKLRRIAEEHLDSFALWQGKRLLIIRPRLEAYILSCLQNEEGGKQPLRHHFTIASAATSTEEIGNPVYPPARRELARHGIPCDGHAARQMQRRDYQRWDYLIGMDEANRRNMLRILGGDPAGKVSLLMDWTGHPRSVADPWYTGDFQATWLDVSGGCTGLLEELAKKHTLF